MADDAQTLADLPIACSLSQDEQAARHEELTNGIFKAVEQVQELADGYAFRFPGEVSRVSQLTSLSSRNGPAAPSSRLSWPSSQTADRSGCGCGAARA